MKIYTKTGDNGTTGIQHGKRISKTNIRIKSYGLIDEINSSLGIILSHDLDKDLSKILIKIQNDLFIIGSDLSDPNPRTSNRVNAHMICYLENMIDLLDNELPNIKNFIMPGGNIIASYLHLSRSITRRSEISVIEFSNITYVNKNIMKYLNRLSDLIFVIARVINKRNNINDIFWKLEKI